MNQVWNRRRALTATAAAGVCVGTGTWTRNAISAPGFAKVADDKIERLAERIMETPPDQIVDFVISELQGGLSRQHLLAASFNAGARFHGHHSAYVAHPVNVVADQVSGQEGLLPLFYYLSVLRFRGRRPKLGWLDTNKLPSPEKASQTFHPAMEEGDRKAAALALISLGREYGYRQAYNQLWMYGAERNHSSGGHTAISVVNTFRSLQATDWQCAETALGFAVGDEASRPPRGSDVHAVNRQRAGRISELPKNWSSLQSDRVAVLELLDVYRKGRPAVACETTFDLLREGKLRAGSVWDAVFLTTAELVIRYKWVGSKMLAGHSVTCTNALHYMFRLLAEPEPRLYALLEAVEWTSSFLERERARPALRERSIVDMEPAEPDSDDTALEQAFSLLPPRRFASMTRHGLTDVDRAMEIVFAWAQRSNADGNERDHQPFLRMALHLMCRKSTPEVHDFKFPIALFENYQHASPEWRPNLLAASMHLLQGTAMEDSLIVELARQRLRI